jgi:hypothetical protein
MPFSLALSVPLPRLWFRIVGMFNLDQVAAHHRQLVGRKRSRQHMRDVDYSNALKRSRHRLTPYRGVDVDPTSVIARLDRAIQ